jgi:DNA-binding CsgD family transcriptional regulator
MLPRVTALSGVIGTRSAAPVVLERPGKEKVMDKPIMAAAVALAGYVADDDDVVGDDDDHVGLVMLSQDDTVHSANPAADHWLHELGSRDPSVAPLPTAVRAVAAQARRTAAAGGSRMARTRVRTRAGRWAVVRGSMLGEGPDARVAVVVEPARPSELAPLIADAYGMTQRERRVTELIAQGYSTIQIARRLHLSRYTVQDHLKAAFARTDTRSRGELVARLFFDHDAPKLADTEAS